MKQSLSVLLFVSLLSSICHAQNLSEHERLALESLELTYAERTLNETINIQASQIAATDPSIDVMTVRADMQNIMGWDVLKEDLIEIGTQHFTIEEFKKINAFYRSDIGKTYAKKSPALSADISRIIVQNAQKMMLQTMPAH